MNKRLILCPICITLIIVLNITVLAQDDTSSDEATTIFTQGSSNIGAIQPISVLNITQTLGIDVLRDAQFDGRGVRIGVLDRGFGGIVERQAATNMSVSAFVGDPTIYDQNPITHGTDVLEIITTIAPASDLYICEYSNLDEFTSCIDWFIISNVRIVNHSAGVPSIPLDGQSVWAQEVNRAANADVLWVNAAGNFADGVITDFFTDTNLNTSHEYRGGVGVTETLWIDNIQQTRGRIMLSWTGNNAYTANQIDINLEITNQFGDLIARSDNLQSGSFFDTPLEIVEIDMNQTFGIRVLNVDGRAIDIQFALYIEFANIPTSDLVGSIISPADSLESITVGALRGDLRAPYSSHGPTANGSLKPDIMAQGEVTLRDGRPFIGTSVAAPIVAATAALLKEANPEWSRITLANYLRDNALDDRENPGDDNYYGQGILRVNYVDPEPTPLPTAVNIGSLISTPSTFGSATPTPPEGMILVESGCFTMGIPERQIDSILQQCQTEIDGCTRDLFEVESPASNICFSEPFWIDRTEVTNADYGSSGNFTNPQQPRDSVSWFDAYEFCQSRGGRLPTEAEWEYAARGNKNYRFPWGNSFNSNAANYNRGNPTATTIVGNYPQGASWIGAVDMSGNLWEWTNTIYNGNDYPYSASDGRENYDTSSARVVRGGSWLTSPVSLRTTDRTGVAPSTQDWQIGFRCVQDFNSGSVCSGGLAPRLQVGALGRVLDNDPTPINLRSFGSTNGNRIGQIPAGAFFQVRQAPLCAEGLNWYVVSFAGITGWIAEGSSSRYFTEPAPQVSSQQSCNNDYFVDNGNGCPIESAQSLYIAFQRFENGFMVWRSEPDDFFAFFNDGTYAYYHSSTVSVLPDNPLSGGDAERVISGFGRVWGNTEAIRQMIGLATDNELAFDATYQSGEVVITRSPIPIFYLNLPDGNTIEVILDGTSGWRLVSS